jgi:pimeloyl-ACP methyl ester carboxylesterase
MVMRPGVIGALLALLLGGCASYVPLSPPDAARLGVSLRATPQAIVIEPASGNLEAAGLLFYPGALVEPEAYVENLAAVARAGFRVVIVRMPLDLAVLAPRKGERVLRSLDPDGSGTWFVGGHSLGGAMAARLAKRSGTRFSGLVLLAAYPADSDSLRDGALPVLSLYASEDGLATPAKVLGRAGLLPTSARYVLIDGGNHAGFGSYGPQKGDGVARVPREEQHAVCAHLGRRQGGWS